MIKNQFLIFYKNHVKIIDSHMTMYYNENVFRGKLP